MDAFECRPTAGQCGIDGCCSVGFDQTRKIIAAKQTERHVLEQQRPERKLRARRAGRIGGDRAARLQQLLVERYIAGEVDFNDVMHAAADPRNNSLPAKEVKPQEFVRASLGTHRGQHMRAGDMDGQAGRQGNELGCRPKGPIALRSVTPHPLTDAAGRHTFAQAVDKSLYYNKFPYIIYNLRFTRKSIASPD